MGNQEHSELCELPELYVLGGLTTEEREAFEAHLKLCPNCREAVSDLGTVAEMLPHAADRLQPPPGMKRRILSTVLGEEASSAVAGDAMTVQLPERFLGREGGEAAGESGTVREASKPSRRSAWERWSLAGISAAAVALVVYSMVLTGQKQDLKKQIAENRASVEQLEQQLADANSPDLSTKQLVSAVTLSPAANDIVANGLATIVIDDKGTHLIVQAENLPQLQNTEAYQVWLLKDGKPRNAGTFLTTDGNGALYFTFENSDFDTIAITQEPDANGTQPRGDIVLSAKLG
ncbi:anti-sigma factor [Paenibacillus sp. HB172176]|uniref:anti-sigma factor n=1 Tax=Paenibacillus sp. HB172176 TaxID=2493690 RepID=UPI00143BD057|nr:anti-sigma factor [Paenibacillus sp. HB172176]